MKNEKNYFVLIPEEHSNGCITEEELDDDDDDATADVCSSSPVEEPAETANRRPISCSTDCKFGVVRSCNTRISRSK